MIGAVLGGDAPFRAPAGLPRAGAAPAGRARGARRDLRAAVKRGVDIVGAAGGLLLLAPLGGLIAIAIRLESPGPVLFRQARVGRDGRPFVLLKFRTMVADAEARHAALLAHSRDPNWLDLEHDPRVTRVGRLLRHSSLDELPQLWNVLRGEMSLVGPRPLIPAEHARLPDWARCRTDVRPGLTGLWQVSGRTSVSFEGMLHLDRRYVTDWSLRHDLALLARTAPTVLSRRGAN